MKTALVTKRRRIAPPSLSDSEQSSSASLDDSFYTTAAAWNLEQAYEQQPREKKRKEKENIRLPIKTADGRIEELRTNNVVLKEEDESDIEGGDELPDHARGPTIQEQPQISSRQQIIEAKEELARIAHLLSEDPEEHLGGFRTLGYLAASANPTVKKLALVTQLAVYKDHIPGYRIRPLDESEKLGKVSKDIRKVRAFEQSLVSNYQTYVKHLSECSQGSGSQEEVIASVATVAISCASTLLLAVPHFNFRGDLLNVIVRRLTKHKRDQDFDKCIETVETLFREDEDGTASLDGVTQLTKMMKAQNYQVSESILNMFLHLRLLSEFSSRGSQNRIDKPGEDEVPGKKPKLKKEFRTKNQRKLLKERKAVEKDFKEADAIVSHEERDRMQSEMLKSVFVTYFRILKTRSQTLMGAVLEGLAKYAHLINQDFLGDLLETLKELILQFEGSESDMDDAHKDSAEIDTKDSSSTSSDVTRKTLLCIVTAFALLEGQDTSRAGLSLDLDLTFFITHLYKNLYTLSLYSDLELSAKTLRLPDPDSGGPSLPRRKVNVQTTIVLLLRSLKSILGARNVPPVRLAAFTKQLCTSSLQLPEKSLLAMLGLLGTVAKVHGRKIGGLWNTEERRGDGVFDPLRAELESSNPFASTIWEGELLKLHYCPAVKENVKDMEKMVASFK